MIVNVVALFTEPRADAHLSAATQTTLIRSVEEEQGDDISWWRDESRVTQLDASVALRRCLNVRAVRLPSQSQSPTGRPAYGAGSYPTNQQSAGACLQLCLIATCRGETSRLECKIN